MKPSLPAIQMFAFAAHQVRTQIDAEGAPWFCAKDVCEAIGIEHHRTAIEKLDEDEVDGVGLTDAIGRLQPTSFVSESGLYTLILRCDDAVKPGTPAHRFRKWVTAEVLPQLRKQGGYGKPRLHEVLQMTKASANLMRRMVESPDQCEVAHLIALNEQLCRLLGVKPPDMNLLGYRRGQTQLRQLSLVPKPEGEEPRKE